MWNVFSVKHKDTRMTSLALFCFFIVYRSCTLSGVSVGGLAQENDGSVDEL